MYYSSLLLLPKTAEFIKGKVNVVSARVDGLNLPSTEWKISSFMILYESLNLDVSAVNNIVVIGDSMNEITAGQQLKKRLPTCVLKLIKMQDAPSHHELLKQLKVIRSGWNKLLNDSRNIDLKMRRQEQNKDIEVEKPE